MTAQDIKDFFVATLKPLRNITQEIAVLNKLVDWISEQLNLPTNSGNDIVPWNPETTFNKDGVDVTSYCSYNDTAGVLRFWYSKVNDNIGNTPPTDPEAHENAFWLEVSPSYGTPVSEWKSGFFGNGVQLVFVTDALYFLNTGTRPYYSSNFPAEVTAGIWRKLGGAGGSSGVKIIYRFNSNLFTEKECSFRGGISSLSTYKTAGITSFTLGARLDTDSAYTPIVDLLALQAWINANVTGDEGSGLLYWIKIFATIPGNGVNEIHFKYSV